MRSARLSRLGRGLLGLIAPGESLILGDLYRFSAQQSSLVLAITVVSSKASTGRARQERKPRREISELLFTFCFSPAAPRFFVCLQSPMCTRLGVSFGISSLIKDKRASTGRAGGKGRALKALR